MFKVLGDGVERFLDYHFLNDVVAEDSELIGQHRDAQHEFFNSFACLEREIHQLLVQLLSVCHLDAIDS